jgi:hypothetical protein
VIARRTIRELTHLPGEAVKRVYPPAVPKGRDRRVPYDRKASIFVGDEPKQHGVITDRDPRFNLATLVIFGP